MPNTRSPHAPKPLAMVRQLLYLAVCTLVAPLSALSQSRPATVSPPSSGGTVAIRAAIVLPDYTVKPLPLLPIVAKRGDRADSVSTRTDLDGRVSLLLTAGVHTIAAQTSQPVGGHVYAWLLTVIVRAGTNQTVELTNANALPESAVASTTAPPVQPQRTTASVAPASTRGTATHRQVTPESEVFERVRTGVFRVEAGAAHGTGFLADTLGGVVITNDHVVGDFEHEVSIYLDTITRVPAQVLARDREADLAVLRVSPNRCRSCARLRLAPPGSGAHVEAGERLLAIGFPLSQQLTLTSGIASSIREGAVISDVNINHGNSGGPMLNLDGEVVAINTFLDASQTNGPGISGSILVTRLTRVLDAARTALAQTQPPSDELLPAMPTRAYPLDALKQHVASLSAPMYRWVTGRDAGNFTVTLQTPAISLFNAQQTENVLGGDRREREQRAGVPQEERYGRIKGVRDWYQYVGPAYLPVITVSVVPKIGETGWSSFARALQTVNYGTALSPGHFKFRGDLRGARFYRNGVEVRPLSGGHRPWEAYVNDRWVRLADVADEGIYVLPPDLFAPDSLGRPAMVTMVFQDIKNPQSGSFVDFYDATAANIWNDFVPYYQTVSPERQVIRANPAVKSPPAPMTCSSQTGICVPRDRR